jgi:hypothetical protein
MCEPALPLKAEPSWMGWEAALEQRRQVQVRLPVLAWVPGHPATKRSPDQLLL